MISLCVTDDRGNTSINKLLCRTFDLFFSSTLTFKVHPWKKKKRKKMSGLV